MPKFCLITKKIRKNCHGGHRTWIEVWAEDIQVDFAEFWSRCAEFSMEQLSHLSKVNSSHCLICRGQNMELGLYVEVESMEVKETFLLSLFRSLFLLWLNIVRGLSIVSTGQRYKSSDFWPMPKLFFNKLPGSWQKCSEIAKSAMSCHINILL